MTSLQVIGIILGILVGLFALELLIVALVPGIAAPAQRLNGRRQMPGEVDEVPHPFRKDVSFKVKDAAVRAWFYLPETTAAPFPCIVMAHGFGGTKDLGLESYAVRFQKAGYAGLASNTFINELCARIVIRGDKYRPVEYARKVRCPVLILICEHDGLTPISSAEETVKRLGQMGSLTIEAHPGIMFGKTFGETITGKTIEHSQNAECTIWSGLKG